MSSSYFRPTTASHSIGGTSTTSDSSVKGYYSTLRKSRILLFNLLYYVRRQSSFTFLHNIIVFLEMLQLLTFPFDPAYVSFGNKYVDEGIYYFSRIRNVMIPSASQDVQTAGVAIVIVFIGIILLLGVRTAALVAEGDSSRSYEVRAWGGISIVIEQIIYLPILSVLFTALQCGINKIIGATSFSTLSGAAGVRYATDMDIQTKLMCSAGSSTAFLVTGCLFILISTAIYFIFALAAPGYEQERTNTRNIFPMTFCRLPLFLFFFKTFTTWYIQFSGRVPFEVRTGLYHWGLIISFAGLIAYMYYYLPFYKRYANYIYVSFLSVGFWASVCGFLATRLAEDSKFTAFIIFIAGFLPMIGLGCIGCYIRDKRFYRKPVGWDASSNQKQHFRKPFEVELYSRGYTEDNFSPSELNQQVNALFWRGLIQFPDDIFIRIAHVQFLLQDHKRNFQMITKVLEKVRSPTTSVDVKFVLYCIEKNRLTYALAMDGGAEEVSKNIWRANTHSQKAKLLIKSFWESLLHEDDLLHLPSIVAKLEREETKADVIFKKLIARFPKSAAVLRHYAVFIEEVKNDPETAYNTFKQADELEQEGATEGTVPFSQEAEASGNNNNNNKDKDKDHHHHHHRHHDHHNRSNPGTDDDEVVLETPDYSGKQKKSAYDSVELQTMGKRNKRNKSKKYLSDGESSSEKHHNSQEVNFKNTCESSGVGGESVSPRGRDLAITGPMLKRMSKYELMRYRKYRSQAEVSRSHSVWKMTYAINLTLLILLLNMVIVFTSTMVVLKEQENSIQQLTDMVTTRNYVALSITSTLRATRYLVTTNSSQFEVDTNNMKKSVEWITTNTVAIYNQDENYAPVRAAWQDIYYPVYLWSNVRQAYFNNGYVEQSLNALDALTEYTFWMSQATRVILRPNGVEQLWNSTGGRFMLDNGLRSIFDAVMTLVNLYEDKGLHTVGILQKITAIILPFSFVILAVLLWFLLRSAILEIQEERLSILRLFLNIPKDNILGIVGAINSREGKEEEDDLFAADEEEASEFTSTVELEQDMTNSQNMWILKRSRLSMLRNFFFKFVGSLIVVFLLVLIASGIVLSNIGPFQVSIKEINLAGQRRTIASHMNSAVLSLAYHAEIERSNPLYNSSSMLNTPSVLRQMIVDDIAQIFAVDSSLKFGGTYGGGIQGQEDLIKLEYGSTCDPLPPYNFTCTGINSLLLLVTKYAHDILAIPNQVMSFNTTQVAALSDITYSLWAPMLVQAVNIYTGRATSAISRVSEAVIVIFVLIFPVLLVVNFLLRPMARRVKQEHQRTLRMLLMIPLNVIDNTPNIKEYLETVLRSTSHNSPWYKYKQRMNKNNNKEEKLLGTNEHLLHAAMKEGDAAMIVASSEGTIEMVNHASEHLFGYQKSNLIGHPISTLFTDGAMEKINTDIFFRHKYQPKVIPNVSMAVNIIGAAATTASSNSAIHNPDSWTCERDLEARKFGGVVFPVHVNASQFKVNSKVYYGFYVRDTADLEKLKEEIKAEKGQLSVQKQKLDDLLVNMFPTSIAKQLMDKGEEFKPMYIADEYKEATILFADIVGFTQMCSDLEPGVLLVILDGIFTLWDALVDKYQIQKIKTIGDCFMAAGGVPDRTTDHVERVLNFAIEMKDTLNNYNDTCQLLKSRSLSLNLRIGINTGPVVAGIIGKSRMCFDLWGDAVNVASRMESNSLVGRIQVSQTVFNRVNTKYEFEERGSIKVKGKGEMLTYLLVAPRFQRTNSGRIIDTRFAAHLLPPPPGGKSESKLSASANIPPPPSSSSSASSNNNNNNNTGSVINTHNINALNNLTSHIYNSKSISSSSLNSRQVLHHNTSSSSLNSNEPFTPSMFSTNHNNNNHNNNNNNNHSDSPTAPLLSPSPTHDEKPKAYTPPPSLHPEVAVPLLSMDNKGSAYPTQETSPRPLSAVRNLDYLNQELQNMTSPARSMSFHERLQRDPNPNTNKG